jgi:glycosyltransferase involved in cell wall biosynthesis
MRAELEQKHADIVFAGFRTGEDLAQHYASADIFAFASKTETFGNVTIEAMASGLAVVAFRHAAAGELITSGVNGVLADPLHERSFEVAINGLLEDSTLVHAMGVKAALRARALGWPAVVEQTESIFEKILLEHGTPYGRSIALQTA